MTQTNAECCAVHDMTMKSVDAIAIEVKAIDVRVRKVETTVEMVKERVANTKSLVWLVVVSILTTALGIVLNLAK